MAATNRGIFALLDVRERQGAGTWPTFIGGDVWLTPSPFHVTHPFGYFTGGGAVSTPTRSSVDRISYVNDTVDASPRGHLTGEFRSHTNISSNSFTYVGGGYHAPSNTFRSSIQRISYGNDTVQASPKGSLVSGPSGMSGAGGGSSDTNGYFVGGSVGGNRSYIQRLDFSNDTANTVFTGALLLSPSGTSEMATAGNRDGLFIAGGDPAIVNIQHLDYSNDDTNTSPKGSLSTGRKSFGGSSSGSFGYFFGGLDGTNTWTATVERIQFSNNTVSPLPSLPVVNVGNAATGNSNYGYIGGGSAPGYSNYSTVNRIDYANDGVAASPKGPLSSPRYQTSASSGQDDGNTSLALFSATDSGRPDVVLQGTDFGYFGGNGGPKQSVIDRIDYSNDTATASPRGLLGANVENLAATGNGPFGYFGGGDADGTPGYSSKVDRVDYANDTADAAPKGPLNHGRKDHSATGNSNFGYFITGFAPSNSSYIDRVDYANDTAEALTRGNNEFNQFGTASTGNQDFGYVGGGSEGAYTHVSRIDYSNDSAASINKGNLHTGGYVGAATGNANFGYFGGGKHAPDPVTPESRISRIDYSNDTIFSSIKGPLSVAKQRLAATGNANFGYFAGGYDPSPVVSTIERVDYSNDTVDASPKGPLSRTSYLMGASSSRANGMPLRGPGALMSGLSTIFGTVSVFGPQGTDFGYFGGGNFTPGFTTVSTVDRIDYSNDTADASPKGPLTAVTAFHSATGNASFGYHAAGQAPPPTNSSKVDRIDYSNDTVDASPRGPLSIIKYSLAATSTSSFGYFAGGTQGNTGPFFSTIDRIDYSNDTAATSPKGPLSSVRDSHAAAGNQSFGYFTAGDVEQPTVSSTDRLDYSNDTTTASPKGPLIETNSNHAATGNADFGYHCTGSWPGTGSTVNRIDYSNDTAQASPKGPLSIGRFGMGATGNTRFGYFGGGKAGTIGANGTTIVDRIDYSNDTVDASPKGTLSIARRQLRASSSRANAMPTTGTVNYAAGTVSTPNTGYFAGGDPAPGNSSNVQRIDYANDTAIMSQRGNLTEINIYAAGLGSPTHGYVCGGEGTSPSSISKVQRITYLNDTVLSVFRGNLAGPSSAYDATGTDNFGYVAGPGPNVDRIVYANDTATALEKVTLVELGFDIAAAGNQNSGYYAGGYLQKTAVNRLDYANDTVQVPARGPLNNAGGRYMAGAGNEDFAYMAGGSTNSNPGGSSAIDRIDYSNDTAIAVTKGPLSVQGYGLDAGTGNPGFGYFGVYNKTEVERLDFSNDTATALARSPLALQRNKKCAFSARENALPILGPSVVENVTVQNFPVTVFGYYMGGTFYPTGAINRVQRINYTNDTVTFAEKGSLTATRYHNFGVSSTTHGYTGSRGANNNSTVDRIDYSNDTATATPVGNLASGYHGYSLGGVGNLSYGYVGGGFHMGGNPPSISTISRIDYSNDTATAPAIANLSNFRMYGDSASNLNYGYFIGGRPQGSPSVNTVDRFDFSSDTTNASPHTQLSNTNNTDENLAATGNGNFAYIYQSYPAYTNGALHKIDYSNDTASPVPTAQASNFNPAQGPSSSRSHIRATGNDNFGYFAGGGTPSPISNVVRLDYANDTTAAVEKGSLLQAAYAGGMTSAAEHGLPQ